MNELNYVDGVTSNIQTQLDAKGTGTVSSLSDLSVTATAAELNYTRWCDIELNTSTAQLCRWSDIKHTEVHYQIYQCNSHC